MHSAARGRHQLWVEQNKVGALRSSGALGRHSASLGSLHYCSLGCVVGRQVVSAGAGACARGMAEARGLLLVGSWFGLLGQGACPAWVLRHRGRCLIHSVPIFGCI